MRTLARRICLMPICSKTEATLRPRRERNLHRRRERKPCPRQSILRSREPSRQRYRGRRRRDRGRQDRPLDGLGATRPGEDRCAPCQGGVEAPKDKESQEALRPCVGQRLTTGPERRPLPTIASASTCSRPPAERLRRRRIRPAESDGAECRKDHRRRTWKTRRRPICCRSPRKRPSSSGGIGRRARFRSVCPKGRGGSTPPLSTDMRIHNTA